MNYREWNINELIAYYKFQIKDLNYLLKSKKYFIPNWQIFEFEIEIKLYKSIIKDLQKANSDEKLLKL